MDTAFAEIVSLADEGVVVVDGGRRFTYVNARASQLLGRPAEELLGQDYRVAFPTAVGSVFDAALSGAIRDRRFARASGFTQMLDRWVEIRVIPSAEGATIFLADITSQKKAELDLRASERRLLRAQAVAHVGSWEMDLGTREMWASEEAFRIYGLERTHDTVPLEFAQSFPIDEDRPKLDDALRGLLSGTAPYDVEFRVRRRSDGQVRVVHSIAELERDEAGRPARVVGTIQDVTRQREIEAAVAEMARLESVGRLAGGIAHDFNNMMTAIRGYAELVAASAELDEGSRSDLHQILDTADRAAGLTRQLLAFSRRQFLVPRLIDVNAAIQGLVPLLRRLLGEHIRIELVDDPATGCIRVDPTQLDQVLVNLAINARDAMGDGGTLTITTRRCAAAECLPPPGTPAPPDLAAISVSDTGTGMDAATRSRIFEPFFTTKASGRGDGLGLATVYGIVTQSNGWIEVDSEPGMGSTFRIFLPREEGRADAPVTVDGPQSSGSGLVVVVEDDPGVRDFAARTLARCGYRVVEAGDGLDGLGLIEGLRETPDLLLTDVVMPGMGGRELAERVREKHPELPVIFMSGFDGARAPGEDDMAAFVAKPFTSAELAAAIQKALAPKRG